LTCFPSVQRNQNSIASQWFSFFTIKIGLAAEVGYGYASASFHQIALKDTDLIERKTLGRRDRLLTAMAGMVLVGMLSLTAMLRPNPHGLGTHQRLGFPPCSFLLMFHRPCPTCGMTTAWAHLGNGEAAAAVRASLTGSLLWILAVLAAVWLLGTALRGRWFVVAPNRNAAAWISTSILVVMLVEWAVRLSIG